MTDWVANSYEATHNVTTDMQNIENNLNLLRQCFKGSTAPVGPTVGQFWFDTANNQLKVRNEDSAWVVVINYGTGRVPSADSLPTISVTGGTGLSGGGTLDANRTISHSTHTGDVTGSTSLTIADNVITRDQINDYVAGSAVESWDESDTFDNDSGYVKKCDIFMPRAGTVTTRLYASIVYGNDGGGNPTNEYIYARIYKDGGAAGTARSLGGGIGYDRTSNYWHENISFDAGQRLQIYAYISTNDNGASGSVKLYVACGNPIISGKYIR